MENGIILAYLQDIYNVNKYVGHNITFKDLEKLKTCGRPQTRWRIPQEYNISITMEIFF